MGLASLSAGAQAEPLWCFAEPLDEVLVSYDPSACGLPARGSTPLAPLGNVDAAAEWGAVRAVLADAEAGPDEIAAARIRVESLRTALPELLDQLDLFDGLLALQGAPSTEDCDTLGRAAESVLPRVALEARVARAECLLRTDHRRAEEALDELARRYPELPSREALELLRGESRERRGDVRGAVAVFRALDLEHPGVPAAAGARAHLARLGEAGERVPPYSPLEDVGRAERLVRSGPPELAREAVERLRAATLPAHLRAEVTLLASRLARVEGRFEEARALMREARGLSPEVGDDPEAVERTAADLEAAAARSAEEARGELRAMGYGRGMRRASATRLYLMARVAARSGLREELGALLDEILRRGDVSCVVREDVGIISAGSDDARVARVLEGCPSLRARYHRARALERSGERGAAISAFRDVVATDDTDTRFYTLWSEARLSALAAPAPIVPAEPAEPPVELPSVELLPELSLGPLHLTPMRTDLAPGPWSLAVIELGEAKIGERRTPTLEVPPLRDAVTEAGEIVAPPEEPADEELTDTSVSMTDGEVIEVLERLGREHEEALPWIGRARARLAVGDVEGATEELFAAWAAWHEATGGAPIRAGLEAVYRGAEPGRLPTDLELRRARRRLMPIEREELADVAAELGDYGLAVRFGGAGRIASRPRPYPELVRAAAERHDLDPNLIWAVMRVESIYNPRIVSYAGAIGLLQIMPRTGRLIAHRTGRQDFTVADLLEPATNIELGAWYLRSLLDRFDGRLPLAIAAYNGGPHNVRRWMADHADALPVDALCERIPFDQTFRYVRRVLHHYRAYRAEEGLGLPELEPALPPDAVDTVAF